MTSPDTESPGHVSPDAVDGAERAPAAGTAETRAPALPGPAGPKPVLPEPVLPEQSREDTDAGWGEYPEYPESSDDRLSRDRPPHWADY